jgi:hypothetical protein
MDGKMENFKKKSLALIIATLFVVGQVKPVSTDKIIACGLLTGMAAYTLGWAACGIKTWFNKNKVIEQYKHSRTNNPKEHEYYKKYTNKVFLNNHKDAAARQDEHEDEEEYANNRYTNDLFFSATGALVFPVAVALAFALDKLVLSHS